MISEWLETYRRNRTDGLYLSAHIPADHEDSTGRLVSDTGFNNHDLNDGSHVSPYDNGRVMVGTDGIEVRLIQGIDEAKFAEVLSFALRATTGINLDHSVQDMEADRDEMLRGGLQAALETQVIVFAVSGVSRACTHQLVRTRKAGFHQQSQRATYYGDTPDVRVPASIANAPGVAGGHLRYQWEQTINAAWAAYRMACEAGVSYQDARYILPEGTGNFILCEYTVREFINVFAYRGCSMFQWEHVAVMREMRRVLLEAHSFLEPHVKISCEKTGRECDVCKGSGYLHAMDQVPATTAEIEDALTADDPKYEVMQCYACLGLGGGRQCTFQGWENVEGVCAFPWARQDNRTFLPTPKYRIGG